MSVSLYMNSRIASAFPVISSRVISIIALGQYFFSLLFVFFFLIIRLHRHSRSYRSHLRIIVLLANSHHSTIQVRLRLRHCAGKLWPTWPRPVWLLSRVSNSIVHHLVRAISIPPKVFLFHLKLLIRWMWILTSSFLIGILIISWVVLCRFVTWKHHLTSFCEQTDSSWKTAMAHSRIGRSAMPTMSFLPRQSLETWSSPTWHCLFLKARILLPIWIV